MNIDKGLIRHWACLCESEEERLDEVVRGHTGWDDDDPGDDVPPVDGKTIDNRSNERERTTCAV